MIVSNNNSFLWLFTWHTLCLSLSSGRYFLGNIDILKYIESPTLHTRMNQNWEWTFVACHASCLVVCDGSIYGATPSLPPLNSTLSAWPSFLPGGLGEYHNTIELCRQVVNASFAQEQVEWSNYSRRNIKTHSFPFKLSLRAKKRFKNKTRPTSPWHVGLGGTKNTLLSKFNGCPS